MPLPQKIALLCTLAILVAGGASAFHPTAFVKNPQASRLTTRQATGLFEATILQNPGQDHSFLEMQDKLLNKVAAINTPVPKCPSTDPTKIVPNADTQKRMSPSLSTWKRRLMTKEDKKNIHKIASLSYVLSSVALLGTGALNGFTEAPDFLGPITEVFLVATLFQSISSIDMAMNFRKHDLGARNGFINAAFSSLLNAFLALWTSPFAPEVFNGPMASELVLVTLCLAGLIGDVNGLLTIPAILESRSRTNIQGKQSESSPFKDFISYLIPVVLISSLNLMLLSRLLDSNDDGVRARFLHDCINHVGSLEGESQQIPIFYSMVLNSCGVSYSALAVTLRDKKLITKNQEQFVLGSLNVVAPICSIHAQGWV